jgi:hypothetical protein
MHIAIVDADRDFAALGRRLEARGDAIPGSESCSGIFRPPKKQRPGTDPDDSAGVMAS